MHSIAHAYAKFTSPDPRPYTPQAIDLDQLIAFAQQYTQPTSAEYKLLELAINMVLASYLEQAQKQL